MTNSNFTNQPPSNPEQDKAAEQISNMAQDKTEDNKEAAKKIAEETPKTPEEFDTDERMGNAPKSREHLRQKIKEKDAKKKGDKPDKFEIDLDNYTNFVDRVTSPASKDFNALIDRYSELKKEGCNISRLDTAASGLCSESGEFMEIVKKLKFQGKPYNEAQKELSLIHI